MDLLVIGASANGKSAYAEERCARLDGPLVYIATMEAYGEEGRARVERHRRLRAGRGFTTLECPRKLGTVASDPAVAGATVLLEGLGTLAANELFDPSDEASSSRYPVLAISRILRGLRELDAAAGGLVVVTDDVFADGVAYPDGTEFYREVLGAVNREAAAMAAEVVEVVSGTPVACEVSGRAGAVRQGEGSAWGASCLR